MAATPGRASVRFYAELNDHLPAQQRHRTLEKKFFVPASLKDVIESFGVPHTEVELVTVNGASSHFGRLVQDGDRVAVYPVFESLDVTPALRVRENVLREPRFVLDVHLGRLAAYLRMLGFDTAYRNCASDPELVREAVEQTRILLTRDRGLLKHSAVTRGYWLRETDSRRQRSSGDSISHAHYARSLDAWRATTRYEQSIRQKRVAACLRRSRHSITSSVSAQLACACTGRDRTTRGCSAGLKSWHDDVRFRSLSVDPNRGVAVRARDMKWNHGDVAAFLKDRIQHFQ